MASTAPRIRWVLGGGSSAGPGEGRTGSTAVLERVAEVCAAAPPTTASGSSSGAGATLYDCTGRAAALRAA